MFDPRRCELGEGPLWHPVRGQLYWFDITGQRLMSRDATGALEWQMGECVSAAGWIDRDRLLIASETALFQFDLTDGTRRDICALEADQLETRSNDGRADPWGGFWIGTMGKQSEPGLGAIYRYYRGELRTLFAPMSIPNAISFTPDRRFACFTGDLDGKVMRVALGRDGWPDGPPEVFLDLADEGLDPDGAVFDASGNLWLAEWGGARVACYGPDGKFVRAVAFAAPHTSCPAFGGPDLSTLFCTSALQDMSAAERAASPEAGMVFEAAGVTRGLPEYQVVL
ncbi:MAG: SMP-30/gluconolactonase/LRE family protein [Albidovulum sp.]